MNINDLDSELTIKSKEIFKKILKNTNVSITFEIPENENVVEMVSISYSYHNFLLYREAYDDEYLSLNDKYLKFFTTKIKDKIKNLSIEEKEIFLSKKHFYIKLLKPLLGKLFLIKNETNYNYRLNYNSVILSLTKLEYDRFLYYTSYVYKLKQLTLLNKELNINQEFTIIFDDDKSISDLYKNINENFKDIISPINSNINNDDDIDFDFDDDDLDDDF